jgi:hypothetical protein
MLRSKIKLTGYLVSISALLLLSISNIIVFYKNQKPEVKEDPDLVLTFWQNFSQQNPTYKDAYIEIAREESKRGNLLKAKEALMIAKSLDPNSP